MSLLALRTTAAPAAFAPTAVRWTGEAAGRAQLRSRGCHGRPISTMAQPRQAIEGGFRMAEAVAAVPISRPLLLLS